MEKLHSEIDALAECTNSRELVGQLQRILKIVAYYISQSEGVILDQCEIWRDSHVRAISREIGAPAGRHPKKAKKRSRRLNRPRPKGGRHTRR